MYRACGINVNIYTSYELYAVYNSWTSLETGQQEACLGGQQDVYVHFGSACSFCS